MRSVRTGFAIVAAAMAALAASAPASAMTFYTVSFTGTIDGVGPGDIEAGGGTTDYSDALPVGGTIDVLFRFSDPYMVGSLASGMTAVYWDPYGIADVSVGGFVIDKIADINDGYSGFAIPANCDEPGQPACRYIAGPSLSFAGGQVTSFDAFMIPASGNAPGIITNGTAFSTTCCYYANGYDGPNYTGHWNFDSAVITMADSVPEPASWALMIGGFGLVGGAMRRKTARPIAAH